MSQPDVTSTIRRHLLLTLAVGMAGMTTELVLIGHVDAKSFCDAEGES